MAAITPAQRLQRSVLLAPAAICRAAATQVKEPEEVWMLRQADRGRASDGREVPDRGGDEPLAPVLLLRPPRKGRASVNEYVLEARPPALREAERRARLPER